MSPLLILIYYLLTVFQE